MRVLLQQEDELKEERTASRQIKVGETAVWKYYSYVVSLPKSPITAEDDSYANQFESGPSVAIIIFS
jgi:hypothetical protein